MRKNHEICIVDLTSLGTIRNVLGTVWFYWSYLEWRFRVWEFVIVHSINRVPAVKSVLVLAEMKRVVAHFFHSSLVAELLTSSLFSRFFGSLAARFNIITSLLPQTERLLGRLYSHEHQPLQLFVLTVRMS